MYSSMEEVGQAPPMRFTLQSQNNNHSYNNFVPSTVYPSIIPTGTAKSYQDDSFRTIPTFSQTNNTASPTGSSKAVIAALRSLQEKIKVLENERNSYKSSVEQIERDTQERLRQLQLQQQQQMQEKQRIREREELIRREKDQISSVASMQSHISILEKELNTMKEKVRAAEVDKLVAQHTATAVTETLNSSIRLNQSLQSETLPNSARPQKATKSSGVNTSKTQSGTTSVRSVAKSRPSSSTSTGLSRKSVTVKTDMPFIVGRSTGKSFHVPSNIQKAVAMINKHSDIVSTNQMKRTSPHKKAPPKTCEKHTVDSFYTHEMATVEDILAEKEVIQETEEERQERETMEKMNSVIQSLTEEYEGLQKQYQSLVQQLNNSRDPLDESILNSTVQATLRKMEQKGDQLEMLKQFHRHTLKKLRMSPKKSATYDPKHLRAVKLLHNFQEMTNNPV